MTDVDERTSAEYVMKKETWNLERLAQDLDDAKLKVNRLCPGGVCVAKEDSVLWEFRSIERDRNYAERMLKEEQDRFTSGDISPEAVEHRKNRLARKEREFGWIQMAYDQSKTDMLKHCERAGCQPLPKDDDRARAMEDNDRSRKAIVRLEEYWENLREWKSRCQKKQQ